MSPLIPEIHDELLAAAERRSGPRHWWVRPRRAAVLAIAGAIVVAGGAVAAGTGTFDAGSGETGEGTYTVRAITDGDGGVCLAVQMSVPDRPDGTPVTCDPRPLSQPLSANFGYVSGERRLVSGVVTDAVDSVRVEPGHPDIELHRIQGAPGRYFDVVVGAAGPIVIEARAADGSVLQRVDGASVGPVGRGDG